MNSIDNVNNPKHYQIEGLNIESIDIIKAILKDNFNDFCLGNVLKYLIRAEKKNGIEDYKKARKYLSWMNDTDVRFVNKYRVADILNIDWLSFMSGVCKNLNIVRTLVINEIFNLVLNGEIKLAIKYLGYLIGDENEKSK